jgi:hypothetical protein
MAYSFRDYLSVSPNSQLRDSTTPDPRKPPTLLPPRFPWWVPSPEGPNTFDNPPQNQLQQQPDYLHIWDPPIPAAPSSKDTLPAPPTLIPPLPSPGTNPFPTPTLPLPKRPPHEVDPSERNPYNDLDYSPFIVTKNISERAPGEFGGGLLGRLLALQIQQSQVRPMAESPGQTPGASDDVQSSESRRPIRSLVARILSDQSDDR